MNFAFTDEQEELRRTMRRFLEDKSPSIEVRRLMETPEGYDEALWKQMAQELGLQGIAIPEAYGGQGFGPVELGVVMEEMGRALLCAPFFSTVCLAANAILNAGTEAQKSKYLPPIASGERFATVAIAEEQGQWEPDGIAMKATKDGDAFRLDGVKHFVVDGHTAHLLLVAARVGNETGLFAVEGDADGVSRERNETMDMTRKLATVRLAGARAERLGDAGWEAIARTIDQGLVFLAAEMAGGAQKTLDMAVDYARNRIQFGRPIGQFQAIKHRCADMLLQVESAKTAAYYAMWVAAAGSEELAVAASMAKAACAEAFFFCASENIQVHGGIGFTWEHDAHLYYRRAKADDLLFGDATAQRERLAGLLGV
jgi:alkylation response protein AidB-like acyl-CoA dehydrogenase